MTKRIIEIFVSGCPLCDEAVEQVRSITCPSCDVRVLDLRTDKSALQMAARLGIHRVPAIVVDGKIAGCCGQKAVDLQVLRVHGVGRPR